jgi:hypothetical protein
MIDFEIHFDKMSIIPFMATVAALIYGQSQYYQHVN